MTKNAWFLWIGCVLAGAGAAAAGDEGTPAADDLFRAGDFPRAEEAYRAAFEKNPENGGAALRLGEIALLENRLDEAEALLSRATELLPEDRRAKLLLAEAHYRRDRFAVAAPLLREAGRDAFAAQLEACLGGRPYETAAAVDSTSLLFREGFPLPVVEIRVNGRTGLFLIDTGASVLILDPAFAEAAGAGRSFGAEEGLFAGGRRAMYEYGRADSIGLGDFIVRNVPIHLKPILLPPPPGGGEPISGVLGTTLLYHFLSTIDYPGGRLVLRKREPSGATAPAAVEIPFRMAGDHYLIAAGTANGTGPHLFLVDTGLAGGGFVPGDRLVEEAGIELSEDTRRGIGGGGPVEIRSCMLEELTLGGARREGIRGLHGGFPAAGDRWGFSVAGIVSHDFFLPWSVTFDFDRMRILLSGGGAGDE